MAFGADNINGTEYPSISPTLEPTLQYYNESLIPSGKDDMGYHVKSGIIAAALCVPTILITLIFIIIQNRVKSKSVKDQQKLADIASNKDISEPLPAPYVSRMRGQSTLRKYKQISESKSKVVSECKQNMVNINIDIENNIVNENNIETPNDISNNNDIDGSVTVTNINNDIDGSVTVTNLNNDINNDINNDDENKSEEQNSIGLEEINKDNNDIIQESNDSILINNKT